MLIKCWNKKLYLCPSKLKIWKSLCEDEMCVKEGEREREREGERGGKKRESSTTFKR